jgi:hypothetical protein
MEISVVPLVETLVAVRVGDVAHDEVGPFVGGSIAALAPLVGPAIVGPPLARYDLIDGGFHIEVGFPVSSVPDGIESITLAAGEAAQTLYVGPYTGLGPVYAELERWFSDTGHAMAGAPWETYLDGPDVAEPRTLVTWPCRSPEPPGR